MSGTTRLTVQFSGLDVSAYFPKDSVEGYGSKDRILLDQKLTADQRTAAQASWAKSPTVERFQRGVEGVFGFLGTPGVFGAGERSWRSLAPKRFVAGVDLGCRVPGFEGDTDEIALAPNEAAPSDGVKIVECHFEGGGQHRQIVGPNFCSAVCQVGDIAAAYPELALEEQQRASVVAGPPD
jgi:hypothetical protein